MHGGSGPGRAEITGLVLAGGRGSRMGGVAKGLQLLHGRPLLAHVLERLRPQVAGLLVNANQELARHAEFGWPVICDGAGDGHGELAGPLAGLLAGLHACPTEWLLCVPCDSPFLPLDLGTRLASALAGCAAELAFAQRDGRAEPVFCLLHRRLAASAAASLERGERRLQAWQQAQAHRAAHFDRPGDAAAFVNINSRPQLQDLQDHA